MCSMLSHFIIVLDNLFIFIQPPILRKYIVYDVITSSDIYIYNNGKYKIYTEYITHIADRKYHCAQEFTLNVMMRILKCYTAFDT